MKNKIMRRRLKQGIAYVFFVPVVQFVFAQHTPSKGYHLLVLKTAVLYRKSVRNHPEKQMLPLEKIPGVALDLRYASGNNFTHKNLYPENTKTTFLRKPAFEALDSVCKELAEKGMMLVIFDAYRPYHVTESLWKIVQDERYAANPAKGSGHNRGIAVDLTLADLKTHELLPMPTNYDNFSHSAHQGFTGIDARRKSNREILKSVMTKYGFIPLYTEWWHFSWPHAENFELLDLSFQQLTYLEKDHY
jgi:zinc D-Ala-D-Ala dipeptidase